MKLDNRRTILVGLAFMAICAFWHVYDGIVPLILKGTFDMNDTLSGFIMALDNILALFLLPFFGSLSDRTKTRIGGGRPTFSAARWRRAFSRCCFPSRTARKT